jgi:chaperonin GroES
LKDRETVRTMAAKKIGIRPLDDRVVVRPEEAEEKTRGGILLPDTAKEKPARGEVVAVGSGKLLENGTRTPPSLKVGDRVLYGKYSGSEIKVGGVEHSILRESEILAILE